MKDYMYDIFTLGWKAKVDTELALIEAENKYVQSSRELATVLLVLRQYDSAEKALNGILAVRPHDTESLSLLDTVRALNGSKESE